MNSALAIMIPVTLAIAAGFIGAFIWSTQQGQNDDLDSPSRRILLDDVSTQNQEKKK
jgi:cbb3-type cytochrome oxidase maturation protein